MNEKITFGKHDADSLLKALKLDTTSITEEVRDEFSLICLRYLEALPDFFLTNKEEFLKSSMRPNAAIDLYNTFLFWKAKERNVTFRVPQKMVKSLNKKVIDNNILQQDWKRQFFHLSDTYKFEFGNSCDFYLNFNSNKEMDGYNLNLSFLKEHLSYDLTGIWRLLDLSDTRAVVNDMFDPKPFRLIPPNRRQEFKKFVMQATNDQFKTMGFTWIDADTGPKTYALPSGMHDPKTLFTTGDNAGTQRKFTSTPVSWLCVKDYESFKEGEESGNGVEFKSGESPKNFSRETLPEKDRAFFDEARNKLLLCLELLKFSHNREFVTRHPDLTNNQKRAAKGLHPKKRYEPRSALTKEKIIELPRTYLDYSKKRGSGTHASPKGHIRQSSKRTYRHVRYVNMRNQTVDIGKCEVNGGPPKDEQRTLAYTLKSSSEMVKDFVKGLTDRVKK